MINSDFLRRLRALTIKEWCQLIRDPSSFAVGLVLPLVLIFIFGSGLSLDLGNTPIAVINQAPGQVSYAIEQGFKGSPYLTPIRCGNIKEAESLMRKKEVKGIVVIPSNFAGQFQAGKGKLQLVVHGVDTVSASSLERYIQQSVQLSLGKLGYSSEKGAVPVVRLWFNAANSSTWYFVPGLVDPVLCSGAFLSYGTCDCTRVGARDDGNVVFDAGQARGDSALKGDSVFYCRHRRFVSLPLCSTVHF